MERMKRAQRILLIYFLFQLQKQYVELQKPRRRRYGGIGIGKHGNEHHTTNYLSASSEVDHGSIGGLTDDDHAQYALLAGRSGGQTLQGGTDSGDDLTLESTSHATKGKVATADIVKVNRAIDNAVIEFPTADVQMYQRNQAIYFTKIGVSGTLRDVRCRTAQLSEITFLTNARLTPAGAYGYYFDFEGYHGVGGGGGWTEFLKVKNETSANARDGGLILYNFTDATRGSAATKGRFIYNSTVDSIQVDDSSNWGTLCVEDRCGDLWPAGTTKTKDLGKVTKVWDKVYMSDLYCYDSALIDCSVTFGGTIIGRSYIPNTDRTYDVGQAGPPARYVREAFIDKTRFYVYTDATRPSAGTKGRIIFNDDDGNLNIDDGAQWITPDGTPT